MIAGVRERLVDAVRLRLRADVPVGIYLSGGIDSSAVAGIVTHLVKEGIKAGTEDIGNKVCTFSIGFDEDSGFDESGTCLELPQHLERIDPRHDYSIYRYLLTFRVIAIAARTSEWLGIRNIKKQMNEGELVK